jgi:hypothetical protein
MQITAIKKGSPSNLIAISIVLALLFFGVFARGGSINADKALTKRLVCEKNYWKNTPYQLNKTQICPDLLDYRIQPTGVDEKNSQLLLRMIPMPHGMYGASMYSSGLASRAFTVDYDAANSKRISVSDGGVSQGVTMPSKFSSKRSYFLYPFDKYFGEVNLSGIDKLSKNPIPATLTVVNVSLSGWVVDFAQPGKPVKDSKGKAIYLNGKTKILWNIQRANVEILSVLVLLLLMLIALASAFAITRSIYRRNRPPSMNLLVWMATILFAILQVRDNFPGNPPLGILIDYVVFFPVLGALLVVGISNTLMWINRSDWDGENEAFTQNS